MVLLLSNRAVKLLHGCEAYSNQLLLDRGVRRSRHRQALAANHILELYAHRGAHRCVRPKRHSDGGTNPLPIVIPFTQAGTKCATLSFCDRPKRRPPHGAAMTTRPSIRRRDMVAHLGGGLIAAQVVRVERDFRKSPDYRSINRLQRASADLAPAVVGCLLHNRIRPFLLRYSRWHGGRPFGRDFTLGSDELVRVLPSTK
jgi:hypothetical protein